MSSTDGPDRRVCIETTHADPETARQLARAVRPDNTAEMDTRVEGARVVTTIARASTGGLESNADDYLRNLRAGTRVLIGDDHEHRHKDEHDNHTTANE